VGKKGLLMDRCVGFQNGSPIALNAKLSCLLPLSTLSTQFGFVETK